MKRVLVAEDVQNIREFVVINLNRAGYETVEAETGDQALTLFRQAKEKFDVVVLDIMMPGEHDGLAVCEEIRRENNAVGIILLTARTQESDKVNGLMMGADDYVTKPFSPSELVARVDAIYRRVAATAKSPSGAGRDELRSDEFLLNLRNHTLHKSGVPIELTHVEFQILEYFFTYPGMALSRSDILRHVWGPDYVGDDKIVDVNIRRLRIKVEDDPSNPAHIITVWGLGYRWD